VTAPRVLHPRHHIDIEPAALARALAHCAHAPRGAADALEAFVCPRAEVLATLSVRSGLDLLLTALALPTGSEVILSGWTIPDMARIVRAHGHVPVPIDCDDATLAPTPEALAAALTPATRVAIVAQLFGASLDLAPFARVCRAHGVVLVDDDAQGFTGPRRLAGSPDADVVFHSFGSIKTATALGGGLVRVRDPQLRARMRDAMRAWPTQPAGRYARKVASYLGLAALRDPARYGFFARTLQARGASLDAVIMGATRGFPADTPEALLRALRWRPCDALCETLRAALAGFDGARVARRRAAGEGLLAALGEEVTVLGRAMPERTHWLFAVLVDRPDALVTALRGAGLDGARGTSSIAALEAPAERPEMRVARCEGWAERVVFLPAYPEVPDADRARMAEVVRAHAAKQRDVPL
jgi:perosamine synthetase